MLSKHNNFVRVNIILMIDCYMHGMVETRMGDIISLIFVFWFFFFFFKREAILENHDDNNNN